MLSCALSRVADAATVTTLIGYEQLLSAAMVTSAAEDASGIADMLAVHGLKTTGVQRSLDALAASGKNRHEHRLVVDTIADVLAPLCGRLDIAAEPQLSRTAALWHLRTPIHATLREKSTTALDLALALHPTPAVGGVPTALAVDTIADVEGSRGFYAGAVGWCDSVGDGHWMVALRGAELSADRRSALARAGGGIVAESDAGDELAETTAKFRTVLTALGVS